MSHKISKQYSKQHKYIEETLLKTMANMYIRF